jgi:hypothetical protein
MLASTKMRISLSTVALILLSINILMVSEIASAQVKKEWEAIYYGPYYGGGHASAIAVDVSGNVYVTGHTAGTPDYQDWNDYATIKYDANGNEVWVARYNDKREDAAKAISIDEAGNVYVSGGSIDWDYYIDATIKYDTNGNELWVASIGTTFAAQAVDANGNVYITGTNYTTVKYDAMGNELWVASYNSADNGRDHANGLAVDSLGNVYVTGISEKYGVSDCITVKYDANGNELWVGSYRGPGNGSTPAALAVDVVGNVYVTATSDASDGYSDYATIKYDTDGNEVWVARYNGERNRDEYAVAIALDANANVYVTGVSSGAGTVTDYATVKYDTNGNQLWVARYDGIDYDYVSGLAVDATGNVYVTGTSQGTREPNHYTSLDGLTIKYDTNGNELWVLRSKGFTPGTSYMASRAIDAPIAVDEAENVYLTGGRLLPGETEEYLTIKLVPSSDIGDAGDSGGGPRDTGPSLYSARAFGMDSEGNLYVTGSISPESTLWLDWITVKYDANGKQLWEVRHDGPVHEDDSASLIAFDGADVYVAGYITSIYGTDYAIVKYDRDGREIWRNSYTEADSTSWDYPASIAVDAERNVYLNGNSGLIKFDKNGNQLWTRKGVPGKHLAIDASGNLYLSGDSFSTAKYDKDGNQLWMVAREPTPPWQESITAMAVDAAGSVYVTGYSGYNDIGSYDQSTCRTIKYDLNGNLEWMVVYSGDFSREWPLALDGQGNVIIALRSGRTGYDDSMYDYAILKYDNQGNQIWQAIYNGAGNKADVPVALRVDGFDNIYVTGSSVGTGTQVDFATVKYDPNGNELWVSRWNGPSSVDDFPIGLLLDNEEHIYVAGVRDGWSVSSGRSFVVVKYSAESGGEEINSGGMGGGGGGGGGCFIMAAGNSFYYDDFSRD